MAKKYITISTNGKVDVVDADESLGATPRLEFMQKLVGGYVERVPLDKLEEAFIDMYGDEEALVKANPVFNRVATDFANRCVGNEWFHLYGNFSIVAYEDIVGGFDWAWLSEKQVEFIMKDCGLEEISKNAKGE